VAKKACLCCMGTWCQLLIQCCCFWVHQCSYNCWCGLWM